MMILNIQKLHFAMKFESFQIQTKANKKILKNLRWKKKKAQK